MMIDKTFWAHHAEIHVKMSIDSGKGVALLGANGSGKTSCFRYFQQEQYELKKCWGEKVHLGFAQQFPLRPLSQMRGVDFLKMLKTLFPERVIDEASCSLLIQQMNFEKKMVLPVDRLSGGENQLLKILLLFYLESDIYFLDEPSHFLDEKKILQLIDLIVLKKKDGKRFVIIDHNKDFLKQTVDAFYLLESHGDIKANTVMKTRLLTQKEFQEWKLIG